MFVPTVIPPQDASPHAQEMGRRIAALIQDYRLQHQDASATDIHFALRIAAAQTGGDVRRSRVAILAALIVAMLLAGLLVFARSGRGESGMLSFVVLGILIAVLGVLVVFKTRVG